MKNYFELNDMISNQKEVLCTSFDKGYKQGLEDGKESVQIDGTEAYQCGVNDAWKVATKITYMSRTERYFIFDAFNLSYIFTHFSLSEAKDAIKAFEEKKKEDAEFKVGDEVIDNSIKHVVGGLGVVTRINNQREIYVTYKDGSSGMHNANSFTKTGRHFPQIEEVLKQLQEVEE